MSGDISNLIRGSVMPQTANLQCQRQHQKNQQHLHHLHEQQQQQQRQQHHRLYHSSEDLAEAKQINLDKMCSGSGSGTIPEVRVRVFIANCYKS